MPKKINTSARTFFSYPSFPSSPTAGGAIGLPTRRRLGTAPLEASPESDVATMRGSQTGGFLEEFLIISGLIAVQVTSAIYIVMLTPILASGVRPLFLIIFACMATCIFVLPFAIAFERKKWPSKLSIKLVAQILLIALSGIKFLLSALVHPIQLLFANRSLFQLNCLSYTFYMASSLFLSTWVTTFQTLMMLGIEKTNPAIASAMPNIAPGIIFIISASLRFEKVDIGCLYSRAKIMGTVLCLSGAVVMSYLQSPKDSIKDQTQVSLVNIEPLKDEANNDWIIGCFYLLAAVLVVSCSAVLQAVTMVHFPAPLSLCSVTSLLGTIFTVFIQIVTEGKVNPGTTTINLQSIIAVMILGGMVIATCVSFQTWAVKKKGPVLVSMFSPVQTVFSTILSAMFLSQDIKTGSLAGMLVLFSGLYMVLWAKKKEGLTIPNLDDDLTQTSDDVEKPLLNSSKSLSQV